MVDGLAAALERAWQRPPRWLAVLLPLEALFALVTAVRRQLYARRWLRSYRAPCPVVVVGNVSVGGTGKTPVVIALARALQRRGLQAGIVSRGYGGAGNREPRVVQPGDDPQQVGDEPALLAAATGVPVVIGADRAAAAQCLLRNRAVDVILSDDGLQHYALERDFEIVTMDGRRRMGNGHLLPVGPLREPARRLASVDWVLVRDGADARSAFTLRPVVLRALTGGEELPPAAAPSLGPVHAVAGIGNPRGFFDTLAGLGMQFEEHAFPDHHRYTPEELRRLDDRPVVMTEKDAVKCQPFAAPGHWALVVSAELPAGLVDAVAALAGGGHS